MITNFMSMKQELMINFVELLLDMIHHLERIKSYLLFLIPKKIYIYIY